MKGLIIIPAYNEEASILPVLNELSDTIDSNTADILVINDCSKDNTLQEIKKSSVLYASLPCNLGYSGALKSGLLYGLKNDYSWMSFMDSDGQHRPTDMKELISMYNNSSFDLIIGSRWLKTGGPDKSAATGRRLGMTFFGWLTRKLTGQHLTDTTSGMKILSPKVASELLNRNFGDLHSEVIIYLHDRGFQIGECPIIVHERNAGSSMYSFQDALVYPLKNLILIAIFKLNSWTLKKVGNP